MFSLSATQANVLVASNSIFFSCFPNPNPLLNPLPVLIILLNPLPVLVVFKILREILSFTRSLMINTHPLVGCLENSDRKVKQFRIISRIASSPLVYCSSIHWPNWMCLVLQRVSRNCHATHIALTERLGSNGFLKGHCHAIWQLYKRLEGAFESVEFQKLMI